MNGIARTRRAVAWLLVPALLAALVGCGGGSATTATATAAAPTLTSITVTPDTATALLDDLVGNYLSGLDGHRHKLAS